MLIKKTKHFTCWVMDSRSGVWNVLNRRIRYGPTFFGKLTLEEKLDKMFNDIIKLLDLANYKFPVFTIKIYRSKDEIAQIYAKYAPGVYTAYHKTIAISLADVSSPVLIHEMTHAIVDTVLGRRPPGRVGECLAIHTVKKLL